MTAAGWTAALAIGAVMGWLLMPERPEPTPMIQGTDGQGLAPPRSATGPALESALVPAIAAPVAAVQTWQPAPAAHELPTPSGPYAPRPRPPAVMAFGAAAPLASGQDTSGYLWGGVKPDLSD